MMALQPARQLVFGVIYAKPPFAVPEQELQYLGRYTHRVALCNDRLVDLQDGVVRFRRKD